MLLEARHISVSFGGVRAVADVSLSCADGEVVGIVGPNGSGKTTFLNALTGVVAATGELQVADSSVPLGRPEASYNAGLQRVFQAPQMFPSCSVLENVALSVREPGRRGMFGAWLDRPGMWRRERDRWRRAHLALEQVGLHGSAHLPATSLPYGRQRLVELARAMAAGPRVLMLDEPSAGLNDAETDALATLIPTLTAGRTGALIVDHKIDFIDRLCDRVVVLALGEVVAEGTPAEAWANPGVIDAYLGGAADA